MGSIENTDAALFLMLECKNGTEGKRIMNLFWIGILTFCVTYVLVPPVIALSWKIGAVDVPCDWRRMHHQSIPRAGGMAIFASFLLGCMLLGEPTSFLMCAYGGGVLLFAVGLADDLFCLGAWSKLLFQIAAATAAVLGSGITSGVGSFFAIVWVLTLTNAHNFIDGLDGLFAGCAAIEGIGLCLVYALLGMGKLIAPPLLLALSCLAFRSFNHYPAQLFAGDCGSGTVGFLLGMLSLPLFFGGGGTEVLSPLFLFAYPLTDLLAAVVRRLLRGKNPFLADRGHLHHRICAAGVTQVQCGAVLLLMGAALGSIGVLISVERMYFLAGLVCLLTVFLMMRIRRFIADFA